MKIEDAVKLTDVAVIFCAPFELFPLKPADYSPSSLIECPHCKKSMWLSEKKEKIMELSKQEGKEILLACFICFKKIAEGNPKMLRDILVENI